MATINTRTQNMKLVSSAYGDAGQALNENFAWLDALLGGVINITGTTPGSPNEGDLYLLSGTITGTWNADGATANDLALYYNTSWIYLTPPSGKSGLIVWVQDEELSYTWSGSAWVPLVGTSISFGA